MKTRKVILFLGLILFIFNFNMLSQSNISYFMENIPMRNELNPAYVPTQKFYLHLIGNTNVGLMTNSFAPSDFLKSVNGRLTNPFNDNGDKTSFLNALKPENYIYSEIKLNLFGFGFKAGKNYFTMGVSERMTGSLGVPYDLPWLLFNGLPTNTDTKNIDIKSLSVDAGLYLEPSLGYSRKVLSNLTLGVTAKLLLGQAYFNTSFNQLNLKGNYSASTLTADGTINLFTPFRVPATAEGYPDFNAVKTDNTLFYTFAGSGMAFDIGAVYNPIDNLTLSASVTDIGSIKWNKNAWNATAHAQTDFKNISFKIGDNFSNGSVSDSLSAAFTFKQNETQTTSKLTSHIRLGAEYEVLDRLGFGLLYHYRNNVNYPQSTLIGSVNFRPFRALNASVSYTQQNSKSGTLGGGLNLNLGALTLYLLSDFIPISYSDTYIPKSNHVNFQGGIILAFKGKKVSE